MLFLRYLPLLLLFAARTAFSQTPYLLEDIHQPAEHLMLYTNSAHLNAHGKGFFSAYTAPTGEFGLYAFDGQKATLFQQYPAYMDKAMATDEGFFFFASIGSSQQELWVTDLTPGQAVLLDTVPFQSPNSYDNPAAVLHNVLYFSQQSTAEGRELWRSDGTPSGTFLLKDLRPGTASSWPDALIAGDSLVYFIATEYGGKKRIWRTDGTPDGTFSLTADSVNLNQVWTNSLQVVGNTLFFQLRSPALGTEVWKSDGTVAGTVKVKTAGPPSSADWYVYTAKIQNKYLFQMNDGVHGFEWWVSDGTFDGTKLLKDIHPGPTDTYSTYAANDQYRLVDDMIFFVSDNGWKIWKTNGTPQGTQLIKDLGEGQLSPTAAADHYVYPLLKKDNGDLELWRTDGSANGTILVKNLGMIDYLPVECPSAVSGNSICFFFEIIDQPFGDPDWVYMRSDGTPGGTNLLGGTPSPEFEHSSPDKFSPAADGSVLFHAFPENDEARIYKVSANEPLSVSTVDNDIIPSYNDRGPYSAGGKAFWFANDSTLRVYDETGVVQQIDLSGTFNFVSAIPFQNALYFLTKNGRSLWRSDGTASGTFEVFLSPVQSNFYRLRATTDSLYLVQSINVAGGGDYLWRSDGTAAGTANVGQIPSNGSTLFPLIVNNRFAVTTYQLTPPVMTLRVSGFPPLPLLGNYGYQPAGLEISGDRLIVLDAPHYVGSQATYSLWAYEAGQTTLLQEFESVVDYDFYNFNGISEQLYGVAGGAVIFGAGTTGDVDLWRSDGTLAGTFLLMDLNPSGSSKPGNFVRYDDQHWLFTAFDGSATAWWISDGTFNGTFKVADLWPATPPFELTPIPSVDNAVLIQNRLFFSMNNGEIGFEPWVLELTDSLVSGLETIVHPLSGLAIFPNPASESIQLSWPLSTAGDLEIRIFDSGGKVVLVKKMARAGTEPIRIPLGNTAPGIYRIQTTDEKGLRAAGSLLCSVNSLSLSFSTHSTMRYLIPVLFFLLVGASACKDKKYCACCENVATTVSFPIDPTPDSLGLTEAFIYIPNIFVYSGEFTDEHFLPFTNPGVLEIVSVRYTDKKGNELFFAEHFQPNDIGKAWDGFTTGGSRFEGAFEYEVVVKLRDGQVKTLNGSACAYPCGDKGFPNDQLDNCWFPSQNNGDGKFDPTLPPPAASCFE